MFIGTARPLSHPGKGCYWTLDVRMGEGNKRDRKRRDPREDQVWRNEDDYSEVPDRQPENRDVFAASGPPTAMRDVQRQPEYVDPGVYAAASRGATQYIPAFMAQADGAHGLGMGTGTTSPPPAQYSAYMLTPTTLSEQSRWATVPYTNADGPAHPRNAGDVPGRQHAREPYHQTPVDWECEVGIGFTDAWRAGRYYSDGQL